MYVVLWYKHIKPIHGRTWNNVASSNASSHESKQITGAKDLGRQIQMHPTPSRYESNSLDFSLTYLQTITENMFQADIRNERATVSYRGEKNGYAGPAVHTCMIYVEKQSLMVPR
ncbi:unnamed protein product [Thelazia callipaeda]|uniref:Ovule protein n=1 Tax=Thelazia callipaeda TaxID=103827 RepID=A0A0N5D9I8_THECL|nr:unnamed protein product [Thelazia callipaeda]